MLNERRIYIFGIYAETKLPSFSENAEGLTQSPTCIAAETRIRPSHKLGSFSTALATIGPENYLCNELEACKLPPIDLPKQNVGKL